MTDAEIRKRRAELEKLRHQIHEEWQAYDARYPVVVGAYKPHDYDRQQLRFVERLQEVSREANTLPATKAAKIMRAFIIIVVAGCLLWLISPLF